MSSNRFKDILNRNVAALVATGKDGSPIDKNARRVQPDHGHHHAGQRLVAPRKSDQRVIAMTPHGQFHAICNHLAADQGRAHSLVPHGNSVGHRNGRELARRPSRLLDAQLDSLRLTRQRDVAGRGFVPTGSHTDERAVNFMLGNAHRVVVGSVRRTRWSLGHMPADQFGLVKLLGCHSLLLSFHRCESRKRNRDPVAFPVAGFRAVPGLFHDLVRRPFQKRFI